MGRVTSRDGDRPELLVRMADVGDTYLSWTWSDLPGDARADRLEPASWTAAHLALDSAVPTDEAGPSEGTDQLARVLADGAFGSVRAESRLAALLGRALPQQLRDDLLRRAAEQPLVRLAPSPSAAGFAWALAEVDDAGTRILDVADLVIDPPTLVHHERSRLPDRESCGDDALWVVDPELPLSALDGGLAQVIAPADLDHYRSLDDETRRRQVNHGAARVVGAGGAVRGRIDREQLSRALRSGPGRFLYVGHVTGTADQPGSSALHLSDELTPEQVGDGDWGSAQPWSSGGFAGRRRPRPGDHLPLTAVDLVSGGRLRAAGGTEVIGAGHELWPMPPRVALIACESGSDYAVSETFGLVTAAINGGAEFVTATLWPMPTDLGLRRALGEGPGFRPLADLVWATDLAHRRADPGAALCAWQRTRLDRWRREDSVSDSPLLWAAVATTHAPAREEDS